MLEFTCPTCGKRMQGDDSSAGQQVQCAACHAMILAPGPAVTVGSITADGRRIAPSDVGFREGAPPRYPEPRGVDLTPPHILRRWMPALIVIGIGLTFAGLLTPFLLKLRQDAARAASTNNLKVIGLAFHNFHDANKRLPFNGTGRAKAGDNTSGSWAFQILPFVNQKPLFERPSTMFGVPVYMCPGRGRPEVSDTGAWSDYCINAWINDNLTGFEDAPDARRTLVQITDGTSNTIMLGQGSIDPNLYSSSAALPQSTDIFKGGDPAAARFVTKNQRDKSGDAGLNWGGPFAQGGLMGMCDGTVRTFSYGITGGVIRNGASDIECLPCGGIGELLNLGAFLTPNGSTGCGCPDT